MSGIIFEHLALYDEDGYKARRKVAAVASKRVRDTVGPFLSNASSDDDFNARLALVQADITNIIQSAVEEFGAGDVDTLFKSIVADCKPWEKEDEECEDEEDEDDESKTSGWEDLGRGTDGKWTTQDSNDQLDNGDGIDIDSSLADAPSAVGSGTLSATHRSDRADGGGAVERVDLPKGDESGLGGPSPKIDKSKAGDEKGHKPTTVDTEMAGTPHPTETQSVNDGVKHDGPRKTPKADLKYEAPTDTSKNTLESVELDTADEWGAGFADGGETHGDHTDTWSGMKGQADPVTASVDPDKNPITELLREQWESNVQSAITDYENGA
jgi:hypothetical protein